MVNDLLTKGSSLNWRDKAWKVLRVPASTNSGIRKIHAFVPINTESLNDTNRTDSQPTVALFSGSIKKLEPARPWQQRRQLAAVLHFCRSRQDLTINRNKIYSDEICLLGHLISTRCSKAAAIRRNIDKSSEVGLTLTIWQRPKAFSLLPNLTFSRLVQLFNHNDTPEVSFKTRLT